MATPTTSSSIITDNNTSTAISTGIDSTDSADNSATVDRLRLEITNLTNALQTERITVRMLKAHHDNTNSINNSTVSTNDGAQKYKAIIEKLRLEVTSLTEALQIEQNAVRMLKAQFGTERRNLKTELARKEHDHKKQLNELRAQTQKTEISAKKAEKTNCVVNKKNCVQCAKLTQDILEFKKDIKYLEDKLQNALEADRIKATDLRTQHEHNVTEIARLQRSMRLETQKLLEELKTKDRIIGQMRRSSGDRSQRNSTNEMRKLRDIDRSPKQITTVSPQQEIEPKTNGTDHKNLEGVSDELSEPNQEEHKDMPPGVGERLRRAEAEVQRLQEQLNNAYELSTTNTLKVDAKETDHIETTSSTNKHRKEAFHRPFMDLETVREEDCDSAVSSAPSSLSPQPYYHVSTHPNFTNADRYGNSSPPPQIEQPLISYSPQPSEGYASPPSFSPQPPAEMIWFTPSDEMKKKFNELNDVNKKSDFEKELGIAKRQVRELERALLATREIKGQNVSKQAEIVNLALSERIRCLEARETSLLTELQEMREQNELQEFRILELEECQDKWSLHSQLSSEYREADSTRITPLSLEMVEGRGDDVREHLKDMLKRSSDPEDTHCLQQILTLLINLESLSQEHSSFLDGMSDDLITDKFKNECDIKSSQRLSTSYPFIDKQKLCAEINQIKGEDDFILKLSPVKKKQLSNASSLQESGIFEGEPAEMISQSTQTDSVPTINDTPKIGDLTAEIQKLNQIRESIEEGKKCSKKLVPATKTTKEIDFYRNRLEVLENKISIYESSGDLQTKKLTERLNHEIYLTSQVKELTTKLEKLQRSNEKLEEERCELEEAENDTRLRCQQQEIELEIISERLRDVEESRNAIKRKAKDAKALATYWESVVTKYEERNFELEERQMDLKHKSESLEKILPALILWNLWNIQNKNRLLSPILPLEDTQKEILQKEIEIITNERDIIKKEKDELEKNTELLESKYKNVMKNYICPNCMNRKSVADDEKKVQELLSINKELKKQIDLLEQREVAYIETLQQADNIWAEMETSYKKRVSDAEENESKLRAKVRQLEEAEIKLRKADIPLNERITELEESEKKLEEKLRYLERENKYLSKENVQLNEELGTVKTEWKTIKEHLEGPISYEMDRQKKRLKQLQEEIEISSKILEDTEESHQKEISVLKMQLNKTNKELVHLDMTNSELKEEISTLETRISEMQVNLIEQRISSDRTIKNLTSELTQRDRQLMFRIRCSGDKPMSLHEELSRNQKENTPEPNDDGLNIKTSINS